MKVVTPSFPTTVLLALICTLSVAIYRQHEVIVRLSKDSREMQNIRDAVQTARKLHEFDTEQGRLTLGAQMVDWASAFPPAPQVANH